MRWSCVAIPLVLAVVAVGSRAEEANLVRLTFGEGWDALPAIVGVERGYFAAQGLVVSPLGVDSAEAVINSLVAGSSDFAVVPQRALLVMAVADVPVRVVALAGWNTRIDLVKRGGSPIASVKGLKGHRIAVGRGDPAHAVLVRVLNAEGLRPSDVDIRLLAPEALARAFESDPELDAVCATGHYTERLIEAGGELLRSHAQIVEMIGYVGAIPLVASSRTLENQPEVARRFVKGWIRSLAHIHDDPEDAARVLKLFFHRLGVTIGDAQALSWVGMTRWDRHAWSEADTADAEFNGWGLTEGGILKVSPKVADLVDGRLLTPSKPAKR